MFSLDPKLFLKKKDGKYNAYSRICPSNVRRQPVILTDEEKERIDKENPDSYEHAIKYGSSKENEFWYICPRYWCLLNNTAMTEQDIKEGKCGGYTKIIPKNAKKVPKDAFVYEFSAKSEHIDNEGDYIQHYPGFVKEGNHPENLCIPCCFKSWDSAAQKKRREKCLKDKKLEKKEKSEDLDEYIKGYDKFPISQGRWGFLPISVQKILHTDNNKCKEENTNNIKSHTDCLLRKGIENNRNQSFIGVISDLYHDYLKIKTKNKREKIPNIKEMKKIIIDSLNLDNFITYFRGSLVSLFEKEYNKDINLKKYENTKIYEKLINGETYELNILNKIVNSFENFIEYLKDDEVKIDHTFLWDIISKPNSNLFPKGLNLCILEINESDNTDNIDILCPTNNYSDELYDSKKQTLIVMKKNDFYEPIYLYRDEKTKIIVKKTFSVYNSYIISNIKQMLEIIKSTYNKCKPLPSLPKVYKFKNNKILSEVSDILKIHNIDIIKQILNYNNKVIGIIIKVNELSGYIPIEPSSIDNDIDYDYIDNIEWRDLNETIKFLKLISKKTKEELPVLPKIKVLEDGLIIGIITETNQFIQIERPEENINFEDMEEIDDINYFISDKIVINSNNKDIERIKMIKKIKLENNFYNAFRNSVRILLNKYENLKLRKDIEDLIERLDLTYFEKLELLKKKIMDLMKDYVEFTNINDEMLMNIVDVNNCLIKEKCSEKQYCLTTSDNDCKLILPSVHLISGNNNNENIYYHRISDEFIRYGRIRNYIFKPKVYLSLDKVEYNLTNNEIILLDTILIKGYFDDLEEVYKNKYISNNVPEFIQPQKTQKYSNKEVLKNILVDKTQNECIDKVNKVKGNWEKFFDKDYSERIYKNTENCSFQIIIDIIKDFNNNDFDINDIKNILLKEYSKLINEYGEKKILNILKDQGKDILIRQIKEKKTTLEQTILSSNYFLTNMDIIIISKKLDLPIIIISGSQLNELIGWNIGLKTERAELKSKTPLAFKKNRKMWITNLDNTENYYYFIKQPLIKQNSIMKYSLIIDGDNNLRINKSNLREKMKTQINIYKKRPSFEDFIKYYIPILRKRNIKLKIKKKPEIQELKETSQEISSKPPKKIKIKRKIVLKE